MTDQTEALVKSKPPGLLRRILWWVWVVLLVTLLVLGLVFAAPWKVMTLLLIFLAAASFLGLCLGVWEIGESIDKRLMAYVFLNGTICLATIGSIGLLLSCLFNGQRRACSLTIILFLSLYIFNLIAVLLEQYPRLKYFSLFNYYDASKIFRRQAIYWPDIAIMLAVFSIMSGASIFTFRRKEIYL